MANDRSILERQMERVELRPFTLDGFHRRVERKQQNRRIATAGVALAVAAAGIGGLARAFLSGPEPRPADQPSRRFVGTWELFAHNSLHTLEIRVAGDGTFALEISDEAATVCDGRPATETAVGTLASSTEMTVTSQVITCEDGTVLEDVPPITYTYDSETDTLSDSSGEIWHRPGSDPGVTPSGGMWPQSTLEEARRAQRLADEGDPRYTWQVWPNVFPRRSGQMDPRAVEFFTRFLEEELGWEEFRWGAAPGWYAGVSNDWPWDFVVVRCAPDQTNPLYPDDPEGRGCAPTLDENRYETVKMGADQPLTYWEAPNGPSGIWVVTGWETLGPADAPITDTHDFFQRQVQQVAPPSDAEAAALLEDFLQARVDGEGAEEYLHTPADVPIPLLYATTSDTPYERSEFELVQGPVWPGGWREFKVRLFTEDGTVVEQPFLVERGEDSRLGLEYGTLEDEEFPTTENGEPLPESYSILDGEVTFGVPPPWYGFFDYGPDTIALDYGAGGYEAQFAVLPDPLPIETGCRQGPAPADAEALARSIRSDPDLEATEPESVEIGGIDALRMDVVATAGASVCDYMGTPLVVVGPEPRGPQGPALVQVDRMRLYLLNLPAGSSARTLAIAFVARKVSFETLLEEEEARIMDSFEFRAP